MSRISPLVCLVFLACLMTFLCLLVSGCSQVPQWAEQPATTRYDISRVFMNKPNDYVILIEKDHELVPMYVVVDWMQTNHGGRIKILTDAPADKPMWAEVRKYQCLNYSKVSHDGSDHVPKERIEWDLHIHNPGDVNGGQWSEKVRSGKHTKVVEGKVNEIE